MDDDPMTNTPSPDEDRELIERLRQMHTSLDGYGALTRPINPDGPKAADRLESLLLNRAKLEAGLMRISTMADCEHPQREARRTLKALNRNTDRG